MTLAKATEPTEAPSAVAVTSEYVVAALVVAQQHATTMVIVNELVNWRKAPHAAQRKAMAFSVLVMWYFVIAGNFEKTAS